MPASVLLPSHRRRGMESALILWKKIPRIDPDFATIVGARLLELRIQVPACTRTRTRTDIGMPPCDARACFCCLPVVSVRKVPNLDDATHHRRVITTKVEPPSPPSSTPRHPPRGTQNRMEPCFVAIARMGSSGCRVCPKSGMADIAVLALGSVGPR